MDISSETKLPKTLHGLLRVAVGDCIQLERNPRYRFNMGDWHVPMLREAGDIKRCEICMAGAVMANTLHTSPEEYEEPDSFYNTGSHIYRRDLCAAFFAIDQLRKGYVSSAYETLYGKSPLTEIKNALLPISVLIKKAYVEANCTRAPYKVYMDAVEMLQEIGI